MEWMYKEKQTYCREKEKIQEEKKNNWKNKNKKSQKIRKSESKLWKQVSGHKNRNKKM